MEKSASFIVFVFVLLDHNLQKSSFSFAPCIRFFSSSTFASFNFVTPGIMFVLHVITAFLNLYLSTKTFSNFASCRSAISFVCRLCFFLRWINVFFQNIGKLAKNLIVGLLNCLIDLPLHVAGVHFDVARLKRRLEVTTISKPDLYYT